MRSKVNLEEQLSLLHVVEITPRCTNCCFRSPRYSKFQLSQSQQGCTAWQPSHGYRPPWRQVASIHNPLLLDGCHLLLGNSQHCCSKQSSSNWKWSLPSRRRLTRSVTATNSGLLSVAPNTKSFRCCGLRPSGPAADPFGKNAMAVLTVVAKPGVAE